MEIGWNVEKVSFLVHSRRKKRLDLIMKNMIMILGEMLLRRGQKTKKNAPTGM
jgi:hypothetical protein